MVHFINHTEPRPGDQHEDDDDTEPARVLRVQLRTRDGQPLGLLVLRYIADQKQDDAHFRAFVEKLSGTLSVAIETRSRRMELSPRRPRASSRCAATAASS